MKLGEKFCEQEIRLGNCLHFLWLKLDGVAQSIHVLKVSTFPFSPTLLDDASTARTRLNGHQASGWKSDFRSANDFDNHMECGGHKRELDECVENPKTGGLRVRYRMACPHLAYSRGFETPEKLVINNKVRRHRN